MNRKLLLPNLNGVVQADSFYSNELVNREYTDYEIEFPFEANWELVLNSDSDEFDENKKS
jgi:hypothetical protein